MNRKKGELAIDMSGMDKKSRKELEKALKENH